MVSQRVLPVLAVLLVSTALSLSPPAPAATCISVSSGGVRGNGASWGVCTSRDGRFVAFNSSATNLVGRDTNGCQDVFLRDRVAGVTTRVSVSSSGAQANEESYLGGLSADGRYIVFSSWADNLVPNDTNGSDVFVRDTLTGRTIRVSVTSAGDEADGWSSSCTISGNGRYVAFASNADNLAPGGDWWTEYDLFLHDTVTHVTSRVPAYSGMLSRRWSPSLSDDGRYLVTNLSGDVPGDIDAGIWVYDRLSGAAAERLQFGDDSGGGAARVTPDGRYIPFLTSAALTSTDTNDVGDLYVYDRYSGQYSLASLANDGSCGNDYAEACCLSDDGRYAVFWSRASNLVAGDTNGMYDLFVRDRVAKTTRRVARDSSWCCDISGDGRFIVYGSDSQIMLLDQGALPPNPPPAATDPPVVTAPVELGPLVRANLHTHTAASGGDHSLGPDLAGLLSNVLGSGLLCAGVSDHAEGLTAAEWRQELLGTSPPPRAPVALRGFEWTQEVPNVHNHINLFGTEGKAMANSNHDGASFGTVIDTVGGLYNWARTQATIYGTKPVGQFNHMGYGGLATNPEANFYHYARPRNADINRIMSLAELAIAYSNDIIPGAESKGYLPMLDVRAGEEEWQAALASGWRLSPTIGADNSLNIDLAAARKHTGVYLLAGESISQYNIMQALLARRTFASQDADAKVELWLGRYFMGSELGDVPAGSRFTFRYKDPTDSRSPIDLREVTAVLDGADGQDRRLPLRAALKNGYWVWTVTGPTVARAGGHYLYIRLQQADRNWIYTAPIWFNVRTVAPAALTLTGATAVAGGAGTQLSFTLSAPATVKVRVTNVAGRPVRELPASSGRRGPNTVLWDGRGSEGQAVPAGRYLVTIEARDATGQQCRVMTACTLQRR